MNDPTSDTLLWEALPDLTLNIAQTAALCGISVRQIGYWTRQGYVAAQGRGARRTYGLEAVRRVLAIRKAMDGGASLRQALRLVADAPASVSPPLPASAASPLPEDSALPPEEAEELARSLRDLFQANRETRDNAGGLAIKLGRGEEDVRVAAESLVRDGVLSQVTAQGMIVFRQAPPVDVEKESDGPKKPSPRKKTSARREAVHA